MRDVVLNNGVAMPSLGLGTWKLPEGPETVRTVRTALELGYRSLDTATLYGNEGSVGKAVRESGVPRNKLFITTKLWPTDFFDPERAFEKSMRRLAIEYADLYLVHWPIPMMPKSIWQAMERIYASGRARAIGISNYGIGDIEKLLEYATVAPAVNQIRMSPFDYDPDVLESCRQHRIAAEAYSPLTRGAQLHDGTVRRLAAAHGKSAAQVMLRWCLQHDAVVIPKASSEAHLRENFDIFDFTLTDDEMRALDSLSS